MGKAWYEEISGEWTPPPPKPDPHHPDSVPRSVQWLPLVLSRQEVFQVLAAPGSELEKLVLRVLYASGMRVEELVGLQAAALDQATSSVRLADRAVVVDPETMRLLLALDFGQWKWTAESVGQVLERAAQSCLVAERFQGMGRTLLPKALRNAYGTHCLENGMDLFSLHGLLGHLYLDTTEFFLELAVNRFRAGYDLSHPLAVGAVHSVPGGGHKPKTVPGDPSEDELRGGDKQADIEEAEVQAMLDVADPEDRLTVRTIYATGLRLEDVVQLHFCDVNYEDARLFVRQSKEHKDRYCLMDRGTAELLRQAQQGRGLHDRVFPGSAKTIYRIVVDAADRAGVLKKYDDLGMTVSPHTLRHACATHMFRRGMDLYGIEKMLGHSDLEATMIYVDCKLPEWRKAYARSHELAKSSGPGAQE